MGPPFENGGGAQDLVPEGTLRLDASMGPPFENGGGAAADRVIAQ